jgi:hypothetical protein
MSITKTLSILAASGALALFAVSPVYAESIPEMEKPLDNSDLPRVEPGATRGADKPIVDQERMQLGNSPEPSVPEGKDANRKGDPSIPELEKETFED